MIKSSSGKSHPKHSLRFQSWKCVNAASQVTGASTHPQALTFLEIRAWSKCGTSWISLALCLQGHTQLLMCCVSQPLTTPWCCSTARDCASPDDSTPTQRGKKTKAQHCWEKSSCHKPGQRTEGSVLFFRPEVVSDISSMTELSLTFPHRQNYISHHKDGMHSATSAREVKIKVTFCFKDVLKKAVI